MLVKGDVRFPNGEVRTKVPTGSGQIDGTAWARSCVGLGKARQLVCQNEQGLGVRFQLESPPDGKAGLWNLEVEGFRFGVAAKAFRTLWRAQDQAHLALESARGSNLSFEAVEGGAYVGSGFRAAG